MKYLVPLINFAAAANGVHEGAAWYYPLVFGFVGLLTAAWAYEKIDMPLFMVNNNGK